MRCVDTVLILKIVFSEVQIHLESPNPKVFQGDISNLLGWLEYLDPVDSKFKVSNKLDNAISDKLFDYVSKWQVRSSEKHFQLVDKLSWVNNTETESNGNNGEIQAWQSHIVLIKCILTELKESIQEGNQRRAQFLLHMNSIVDYKSCINVGLVVNFFKYFSCFPERMKGAPYKTIQNHPGRISKFFTQQPSVETTETTESVA